MEQALIILFTSLLATTDPQMDWRGEEWLEETLAEAGGSDFGQSSLADLNNWSPDALGQAMAAQKDVESSHLSDPPGFHFALPTATLMIRGSTPAFVGKEPASTWQGGAESVTSRLTVSKENWSGGALFDKDAYEPRWDDLSRYYMKMEIPNTRFIAGDFRVSAGEGLILDHRTRFASNFGLAANARRSGFDLSPGMTTSVNDAFRGLAVHWKSDRFQSLLLASDTKYDAIRASNGDLLRISDSGYHRSPGEEVKRSTLREKLVGGGGSVAQTMAGTTFSLGIAGWKAWLSPGLNPTPTFSDPHPLSGTAAGSFGLNLGLQRSRISSNLELASDNNGSVAGLTRLMIDNSRRRSIGLVVYNYPDDYNNYHAGEVSGRAPKGVKGAGGISTWREIKVSNVKRLTLAANMEESWRSIGGYNGLARRYEAKAETDAQNGATELRLRVSFRADVPMEQPRAADRTGRIRVGFSRIVFSSRLSGWTESAINYNLYGSKPSRGIAAGLSLRQSWSMNGLKGIEISPQNSNTSGINKLETRLGVTLFQTSRIDIYQGEFSFPDRGTVVRLNGKGLRGVVELVYRPSSAWQVSARVARTWRLERGIAGSGEFYLSFGLRV